MAGYYTHTSFVTTMGKQAAEFFERLCTLMGEWEAVKFSDNENIPQHRADLLRAQFGEEKVGAIEDLVRDGEVIDWPGVIVEIRESPELDEAVRRVHVYDCEGQANINALALALRATYRQFDISEDIRFTYAHIADRAVAGAFHGGAVKVNSVRTIAWDARDALEE